MFFLNLSSTLGHKSVIFFPIPVWYERDAQILLKQKNTVHMFYAVLENEPFAYSSSEGSTFDFVFDFFYETSYYFCTFEGIFRLLIPSGDMSFPTHYWQSQYIQKNKKPWAHKVKFKSSLISQENNSLRAEWEQN